MKILSTSQFDGQTNRKMEFGGLTLTDTEYAAAYVDWHYHENPHFTLITRGVIRQGTSTETYECQADTLLFHNREEPHYSIKPPGLTRGFQLEIRPLWLRLYELNLDTLPNSAKLDHPGLKLLFYQIYKEAKLPDDVSGLTVDGLTTELLTTMSCLERSSSAKRPGWVKRVGEILHDHYDQPLTLQALALELNLHWAHLSREFWRYFNCNFGEYVRKIRIEKSLALMRNQDLSLTDIALRCGFADQSHFNRCFKRFSGVSPKTYRKIFR